jgi:hypothetical protein
VTAGGKRWETGKAPEVPSHQRCSWRWQGGEDFKSSRNDPLHSRYDRGGMLDYMYRLG